MATLQKIRNQGGLLVGIIMVALLAFIVGDALSSSPQIINRGRNKVGVIAGESLDIQEYQALVSNNENVSRVMLKLPSLDDAQRQQVQDETWQMEVLRIVMEQELEKIGLGVSNDEIYDRLVGDMLDPTIAQFMSSLGVNPADKAQLNATIQEILQTPRDNPYKITWQFLEKQAIAAYQVAKYQSLFSKALYIPGEQVNDLAVSAGTTVDVSYLVKGYHTVSDSAVTVTPHEIKEYYNTHQHLFKQQESRQITYVSFDVSASATDIEETRKSLEELIPEFKTAGNVIEFANSATDKKIEQRFYKKGEMNKELDAFLFDGTNNTGVYGPYEENNAYNLLRVAARERVPDSVRIRRIFLTVDQTNFESRTKLADSLMQELRGGANFELLARKFSADPNSAVNGGDIGWFTQEMLPPLWRDTLLLARKNDAKLFPTQGGLIILQISGQSKPVEKVIVGIVTKEIGPSEQTTNKIYNEARVFVDNVETIADFEKAVADKGQTKRYATLNKNDKTIAGVEQAREIVREAYMSRSTGKVLTNNRKSPIFECGNKYIVAVLTSIKKEGVSPLQEVTPLIQQELVRKKKGEIIAQELQAAAAGSESLLSIARKTNTEIIDATDISFASLQLPGAGIEPKVIAGITRLDVNQISPPITGNQGVFMAIVTNKTSDAEAVSPEEIEQRKLALEKTRDELILYQMVYSIIRSKKIEDFRYRFY
ncbi:MAG: SurA N-terminal domain-containing protein [Odoribacteraceae bacterium]|jgi:peptidyl-prolyl cis-trans isomerase D|nr:SurA N-terminal domain-containing protein [Odoribacteraceae bacterium]